MTRLTDRPARNDRERRIWLWLMLVSSVTGVSIWYFQRLAATPLAGWGSATVTTFSYFTTFTNSIVIVMAAVLLRGRGRLSGWFGRPAVQAACCLYVTFVGLGFWLLLGGPGELVTWLDWLPEITVHSLSPILGAIFWLRGVPVGHLRGHHPFVWLLYPIGYLGYWLVRGPLVGSYPYFFIDVNSLGYGGVAFWSGALVVAFLVLGSVMVGVDRLRARRG